MSALEHFDTILALVAILSGVSLVVTTLTQTLSAALGLRGRHLRWGLEELIENLDPALRQRAEGVSKVLLTHPLVSDSIFARRLIVSPWLRRLRILALWQGWKYANAMRASELRSLIEKLGENCAEWASTCETLLARVDALATQARKVRQGDSVQDLQAELESLRAALAQVTQSKALNAYWIEGLEKWLRSLWPVNAQGSRPLSLPNVRHALDQLREFLGAMRGICVLQVKVAEFDQQFAAARQKVIAETQQLAAQSQDSSWLQATFTTQMQELRHPLDRWFDASMDRVSQHFGSHLRLWTVGFAFLVAFTLQIDVIGLFQRLSRDPQLRAAVVARTDSLLERMRQVAPPASPTPTTASPMNLKTNSNPTVSGSAPTKPPDAEEIVSYQQALVKALQRVASSTNAAPFIAPLITRLSQERPFLDFAAATNWVGTSTPGARTNAAARTAVVEVLKAFETEVDRSPFLGSLHRFQTALEDDFVLGLVPERFAWPWDPMVGPKFWGILVTAIFLSLGAPFWFNLLKNLSNLRPILASKQKAENAHSTG